MKVMTFVLLVLTLLATATGQRKKNLFSASGALKHRSSGPLVISSKDKSLQWSKIRNVEINKETPSHPGTDCKQRSVPKEKQLTHRVQDPLVKPMDDGVQIYDEKAGHRRLDTYVDLNPSDYAYPKPSENSQKELDSKDVNLQDDQRVEFVPQTVPEMICALCSRLSRLSRSLVCMRLFCFEWK